MVDSEAKCLEACVVPVWVAAAVVVVMFVMAKEVMLMVVRSISLLVQPAEHVADLSLRPEWAEVEEQLRVDDAAARRNDQRAWIEVA
jgi:hypothetical protein